MSVASVASRNNESVFTFGPSSVHVGSEITVEAQELFQDGKAALSIFHVATADSFMTTTVNTIDTVSTNSTNDQLSTPRTPKVYVLPRIVGNTLHSAEIMLTPGTRTSEAIAALRTALAELKRPDSEAKPGLLESVEQTLAVLLGSQEAAQEAALQKKAQEAQKVKDILASFQSRFEKIDFPIRESGAEKKGGSSSGDAVAGLVQRLRMATIRLKLNEQQPVVLAALAKAILEHYNGWVEEEMFLQIVRQADVMEAELIRQRKARPRRRVWGTEEYSARYLEPSSGAGSLTRY
jgi:hypothetical protein